MFGPKTLLNPFERYSERTLLIVGVVGIIAGSLIAFAFNGRYDGVVDLHFSKDVSLAQPFIDNAINVVCLLLPLLLLGKFINNKTRLIDILTAILIARIPYYVLPVFNANNFIGDITETLMKQVGENDAAPGLLSQELSMGPIPTILVIVFSVGSIAAMIWMVTILFNGFKTATNLKTIGHKVLFALAIIVAEVLSKIIILKLITQSQI